MQRHNTVSALSQVNPAYRRAQNTYKLNAKIERDEVIVPSRRVCLLQEHKVGRMPRCEHQEHSSQNYPLDKMEQTGQVFYPWDDPKHVHVQESEDSEVGVHDEDSMPAFGNVIGVVG